MRVRSSTLKTVERVVAWYVENEYGKSEGPGCVPFFADARRVGSFSVSVAALERRDEEALFKLLVLFSMFQSRRDVDMMRLQRALPRQEVIDLTSGRRLRTLIVAAKCEALRDPHAFESECSVRRIFDRGTATCDRHPRTPCHVKTASVAIGRMHDMGKIPTSAFLHLSDGWLGSLLRQADEAFKHPTRRAEFLVQRLQAVHRIGRKLASMYVSALSVDELAPGFAPWAPEVDGRDTIVVDTNVSRVIDSLQPDIADTYKARSEWVRSAARRIDLRRLRSDLPNYSARFVQQALYVFRSESNRRERGDPCAVRPCGTCPSVACPFGPS
jgi:hypothetical protein